MIFSTEQDVQNRLTFWFCGVDYTIFDCRRFVLFFFAIPLLGLRVSPFTRRFPHCTLRDSSSLRCRVCSQLHSAFVGFMCLPYLYVSGPLDFCLVIQVLFGPRMNLNACARRPGLGLTSHLLNLFLYACVCYFPVIL